MKRALSGEDIGIVVDGRIIGLRPVTVISSDYALQEYGITEGQLAHATDFIEKDISKARKEGKLVEFKGNLNDSA